MCLDFFFFGTFFCPFAGLIDEPARGVESLVVDISDIKIFSTFGQAGRVYAL
jgi:hypothetical protein